AAKPARRNPFFPGDTMAPSRGMRVQHAFGVGGDGPRLLCRRCVGAAAAPTVPCRGRILLMHAVFEARNLVKVYRMGEVEVYALRGVDVDLFQGEFVVLLGPSGSGKSTLLNILGGLDVPTSGTVHFRDHDLTRNHEPHVANDRRVNVVFVFQIYHLIPSLRFFENGTLVTEIAANPMKP